MDIQRGACRLRIRNLVKTRGDKIRRIRVEIPHLEVAKASFVAIVGRNGSGKSTLLDMLGLILTPDQVDEFSLIRGRPLRLDRLSLEARTRIRREHLAYILQTGGLLEFLTLRENIRFAARLAARPFDRIEALAEDLGIGDVLDKRPGRVSGGQRQKAAIARALIREPDIILADEPTSALDSGSAERLMETFGRMTREIGCSLVMVTHDRALVTEHADRVYGFQLYEASGSHSHSLLEVLCPEGMQKTEPVALPKVLAVQ
uniref:Putative ABC transport system ATP-binding protein n=1 Tax=Candidatus Kentrum sp. DK TaxID=2126562 RepID=A0A450T744_9GAMM|nr:MAG: putative ABC transport system ATP-binding protein [Candidatus Kentron sp. DK]